VNRLVAELAARFGIVVSERVAADAIPVLGALGGATVNVIFMNHFQRIAQGHFTVPRLERRYGTDLVRRHYEELLRHPLQAAS
jgi:EcsC protein family